MSGTRIVSISGLRGIVGEGLDPAAVVEFAAAYASSCGGGPILVGHDGRATAPTFLAAVVAGVTATGQDVIDVGPVATPTLGVLVRDRDAAGGIQISASHNPPEYNGLKFFQAAGMVLSPEAGRAMFDRFSRRDFGWARWNELGRVSRLEPHEAFAKHLGLVSGLVDAAGIARRKFKVVLDSCHGSGGSMGAALLRDVLGCDLIHLGPTPDGLYDHPPEPTEAHLREVAAIVPAVGADVGFIQDPDADRLAIIDETGRYIGEELTLALAAWRVAQTRTGTIVVNLSTSRVVEDLVASRGCAVERTPVGEIHVVNRMREVDAILGGEGNGGVIDPRVGFVRDSFAGMAHVLASLLEAGGPLSKLIAGGAFSRYEMVKMKYALSADSPPMAELLDRIADAHPDAKIDRRDGLRLDWHESWAHIRGSNTEPIVRVIAEAPDRERARELAEFLGRWVRGEA